MSGVADAIAATVDPLLREALLFAGTMFAIGGIDDLVVDLAYLWRRRRDLALADLGRGAATPIAIFVGAWDEFRVIGAMLRTALERLDHPDYRIFVGCYPNDRRTIAAVRNVAAVDNRVRLVVGAVDGPTTKAHNLNSLWRALRASDIAEGRQTHAIVIHDAEDIVHRDELTVVDALLDTHALVQLPVVPLIDRSARMVSGHYADEFAAAHGMAMVVRSRLGAAIPLAGVGCAIRMDALIALAGEQEAPFEPSSLTEDYELGLRAAALGFRGCFARVRGPNGELIAVRAYFPDTVRAAVVQKARWMTGIALQGWDRIGWGGRWRAAELWMRMRDRRAPLAVVALAAGYISLVAWAVSMVAHGIAGTPIPATGPVLAFLIVANGALLAWRLVVRAAMTTREHGWREGVVAIPRAIVGNLIALLAARRAVVRYIGLLLGRSPTWDKTRHHFPPLRQPPA